jgi:predicted transcriptional regulator
MGNTTTSLKLPDDLKEKVAKLANRVEQTPHAYMVEAIATKVDRDERRAAFIRSAEESAAEFKRTGVAYRHEDVERWLLAKLAGKRVRRPKPIKVPRDKR